MQPLTPYEEEELAKVMWLGRENPLSAAEARPLLTAIIKRLNKSAENRGKENNLPKTEEEISKYVEEMVAKRKS